MSYRSIYRSLSILLLGLSVWHGVWATQSVKTEAPMRDASYISMIKSAIEDEMVVATSVKTASKYGVESVGKVSLNLNVLIAPFAANPKGFSTHVIYMIPGYGYVIRVVSVYPTEKLAMFWLGYSDQGPGIDTGINCTHSRSNCEIEDIPFSDLKTAFCSWWVTPVTVQIGDSSAIQSAKKENAKREKLRYQLMNQR